MTSPSLAPATALTPTGGQASAQSVPMEQCHGLSPVGENDCPTGPGSTRAGTCTEIALPAMADRHRDVPASSPLPCAAARAQPIPEAVPADARIPRAGRCPCRLIRDPPPPRRPSQHRRPRPGRGAVTPRPRRRPVVIARGDHRQARPAAATVGAWGPGNDRVGRDLVVMGARLIHSLRPRRFWWLLSRVRDGCPSTGRCALIAEDARRGLDRSQAGRVASHTVCRSVARPPLQPPRGPAPRHRAVRGR